MIRIKFYLLTAFHGDAMVRITPKEIKKRGKVSAAQQLHRCETSILHAIPKEKSPVLPLIAHAREKNTENTTS